MQRVLLMSANPGAVKPLKSALLGAGWHVQPEEPDAVLARKSPAGVADVVVLDVEQVADVKKLCQQLRRERSLKDAPLVLLIPEERLGDVDLSSGVDDYLTSPVSPRRLLERLNFLLLKRHGAAPKNGFACKHLMVDFERYEVQVKGEPVDLTYKEFELLKFLVMNPGRVFTREALLDRVWGYDYYGGSRTVDVHIRRLRAKIETGGAVYVDTVRNVGYKFIPPS